MKYQRMKTNNPLKISPTPPSEMGEGDNWSRKRPRFRMLSSLASRLMLIFFASIGSACVMRPWQPLNGSGYGVEKHYAIVANDSLLIAVRPLAYSGTAANVSSNFFTLWVQTRNLSKRTVSLNRSSFGVISGGRQYDFVPLEFVLGSLRSGYLIAEFEDPFNSDPLSPSNLERNNEKYNEAYFEVLNSHFSFGDLLPGGMKEGYLFYNNDIGSARTFSVDIFGTRVDFAR